MTSNEVLAIKSVKRHFRKTGFWRKSVEEKEAIIRSLHDELCFIWGENIPLNIDFSENALTRRMFTGGGCVNHHRIFLYTPSLMTYLHEFRHSMQRNVARGDVEGDAYEWSHMIFSNALPRLYARSLKRGRFFPDPRLPRNDIISLLRENGQRLAINLATQRR